jgi:hypothetical protein
VLKLDVAAIAERRLLRRRQQVLRGVTDSATKEPSALDAHRQLQR